MRVIFQKDTKRCPICGSYPVLDTESLDRGNGHGYPGSYLYGYACPDCEIPKASQSDSISIDEKTALRKAKKYWEQEVDRIQKYLDVIYVRKGE